MLDNDQIRAVSQPVELVESEEFSELISTMLNQMSRSQGVGISAIQVGKPLAIFIATFSSTGYRVFVNPVIKETSEDEHEMHNEGCLSVPHVYHPVRRHKTITLEFTEYNEYKPWPNESSFSERLTETFTDMDARVIQHEMDHLNGVLFIDHLSRHERRAAMAQFKQVLSKIKKS